MSSQPPNTRVQRTRSSASPPRSPLTRYPLGRAGRGPWAVACLSVALATACISVGGRLRWDDWSSSYADTEPAPVDSSATPGPSLLIKTMDLSGGPLPDVYVDVDGPSGSQNCLTDSHGFASRTLGPGSWRISLSAAGWYRISRQVVIRSGQRTTLIAYLRPVVIA